MIDPDLSQQVWDWYCHNTGKTSAMETLTLASRNRRNVLTDALQGLGQARGAHISLANDRFTFINAAGQQVDSPALGFDPKTGPYIDVVVIDANANSSKIFWGANSVYDPNNVTAPVCYSDNGTGPSSNAQEPQSPTCAVCPWNERTSAQSKMTGKPMKACSDRKKLALVVPGDTAVNVYEMQVPPASLTPLKAYAAFLATQTLPGATRTADIADVVTRIGMVDKRLTFAAVSLADDEATLRLIEHIDTNHLSDAAVGRNDVACDPARVTAMLEGRTVILPPPVAPAAPDHPMPPPRHIAAPAAPVAHQPETAAGAPASPTAPKRGRPRGPAASMQAPATAPFMTAAAAPAPLPPTGVLDVPDFLKQQNGAPSTPPVAATGAPAAPQQRFGMAAAPAPPPAVADALSAAMNLPTRR